MKSLKSSRAATRDLVTLQEAFEYKYPSVISSGFREFGATMAEKGTVSAIVAVVRVLHSKGTVSGIVVVALRSKGTVSVIVVVALRSKGIRAQS